MKSFRILVVFLMLAAAAVGQDWAKARLEKSPRHLEFVKVTQGNREVTCFVGYPEVKDKATVVIVIHEIFGLSDWVRGVVDQLAEAGYIAIAPDLLSGLAPGGGGTAELGGNDAVRKAISSLPSAQITADLNAVVAYVNTLPAANGKIAVTGFCWGGGQTFRFATNHKQIKAALPFYGSGPDTEADLNRIRCPVYGFYAGNDARINAGLPKVTELMKKLDKAYEPIIYDGAGHGFMRAGEAPDAEEANKKARTAAWQRITEILKKL